MLLKKVTFQSQRRYVPFCDGGRRLGETRSACRDEGRSCERVEVETQVGFPQPECSVGYAEDWIQEVEKNSLRQDDMIVALLEKGKAADKTLGETRL